MSFLLNPTPPRLPDPESAYNQRWTAAVLAVLRLYFEQLDNVTQSLTGRNGARFLEAPTASYFEGVDQVLAASTPTAVLWPSLTEEQAVSKLGSLISVEHAGTYSVRATLSVRNDDGAEQTVSVWLRKTGVDLPTSRIDAFIPPDATVPVYVDYIIDLLPTDTFEIFIFSPSASVKLFAPPVAGPVPRGAAARLNVTFVSNNSEALITSPLFRVKKTIFNPPP